MMVDMDDVEELDEETAGCTVCERVAAIVGCAIGGVIFLVGLDLLTNGAVGGFADKIFGRLAS